MGRRVWIVDELNTQAYKDAIINNCPEIAVGVPPIFAGQVGALPCAVEESDSGPVEPSFDAQAEVEALKAEIADLRKV